MSTKERQRLMNLMLAKNMRTFQALGDAMGIHRSYLSQLWHGFREYPTLRKRIADFFGVPVSEIFETSNEEIYTQ